MATSPGRTFVQGLQTGATIRQQRETRTREDEARTSERVQSVLSSFDGMRERQGEVLELATTAMQNAETPEQAARVGDIFRRKYRAIVERRAALGRRLLGVAQQTGQPVPEVDPEQFVEREMSTFDAAISTVPSLAEQRQRSAATVEAEAEARARGTAAGTPDDPRMVRNNVDIITQDGGRIPAVAETRGDQVFVADEQGNFRPLREVFPNAVRVEQPRTRTQEIPTDRQPFTREDFVAPTTSVDVEMEAGVGPFDAAAGRILGIPVLSQVFTEIAGEGAGEKQRQARLVFEDLANRVRNAFRPGEGGRISNLELNQATRLVPSFGAFAQEAGTREDLKTLRALAERRLQAELQVVNQPDRFDQTLVREAQQRLRSLGEVITLTEALLEVSENVADVELSQTLGKPVDKLTDRDIQRIPQQWNRLSPQSQRRLIESLSDTQAEELLKAFETQEKGNDRRN